MTIVMERLTAILDVERPMQRIIHHLASLGYKPLITSARHQFLSAFDDDIALNDLIDQADGEFSSSAYERQLYLNMRRHSALNLDGEPYIPLAGDLFKVKEGNCFLYVIISTTDIRSARVRAATRQDKRIEIGYIGDSDALLRLEHFKDAVSDALATGSDTEWKAEVPSSQAFKALAADERIRFEYANQLPNEDSVYARGMVRAVERDLAILVRQSGGVLTDDVSKRMQATDGNDVEDIVERLAASDLLARNYVVICRKTSNQVNRVASKDDVQVMAELGVKCSCGRSIAEERIEELVVPTEALHKMLNQSYWMSVTFVDCLKDIGIPTDRILLNLQEGPEEIDAFIDIDGTLVMVELKDNEFSMGHAYPFAGRIGLYEPDYAVVVATKGVSTDVKDYFNRVKPESELVYVNNLDELRSAFTEIVSTIRISRAYSVISVLEALVDLQGAIRNAVASQLKA